MFRNYKGLWMILIVGFVVFAVTSAFEPISLMDHEFKSSKIWSTLTAEASPVGNGVSTEAPQATKPGSKTPPKKAPQTRKPAPTDTVPKTILFFGDSMLDGLYPRLAAYAEENGHTLYVVIWYSSTSEVWGKSDKLKKYITDLKPDFIFVSL